MEATPVHILLADDHVVVKSGLKMIINGFFPAYKISSASFFEEIFEKLKKQPFNLLILDATFPEGNSLTIIEKILSIQPTIKILMYTALEEKIYAPKFFSLGVKGYLSKLSSEEEIIAAVTRVLRGDVYLSKSLNSTFLNGGFYDSSSNPFKKLSQREFQIMELMLKGEANLEISNKLDIKPSTISTYKNRLFEKLDINNVSDLIALYQLHHLK